MPGTYITVPPPARPCLACLGKLANGSHSRCVPCQSSSFFLLHLSPAGGVPLGSIVDFASFFWSELFAVLGFFLAGLKFAIDMYPAPAAPAPKK